ncbi:glycerol dehydrogenase [Telmatospirillum siberiense]|uniref:Glycerol dehydrogenase n=1 Tax=Telmatospirillum siberiense TaxID=382514 RepID=A0A2N3Q118_9PROT|nr:glycerol dehydrogenase [Telmatospirillum siberiense]PKU26355.1 glycerol dehydrogenase [Telmatospirillum siberiense]
MITTSIFPGRYVQGAGALKFLAQEVGRLGSRALAIVSGSSLSVVTDYLRSASEASFAIERFGGECCDLEIERGSACAKTEHCQVIVGVGGGKCVDTAKAIAHGLGLPVVIVPTIASTDAPCSALAVIYTQQGAFSRYLVLPRNPDVVLVDTALIARAPVRFLVSGMGDALSTWFEAEDCQIRQAANMTGRPGSVTAYGLARLCYDTLLRYGVVAKRAAEQGVVTPALEHIVETNTLLSGLGFESGGLSGAHAIHNGLTVLEETHAYWHGEKVAIGTLALLFLTDRAPAVITQVFDFCEAVGLPITLAQIGLGKVTDEQLLLVGKAACADGETIHNVPCEVSAELVVAALKSADAEGRARLARRIPAGRPLAA